jgi:tRNA A-37 threonylcarbamoyl transferase component Bud32
MFGSLKLSDLPEKHCAILRNPSSTRPTIWLIEEEGLRAVVKDFSANRFFYRNTVGRFLIWRESKAYRRLRKVQGVPALYRTIDGVALVIEKISARSVENLEKEMRIPESFFEELKDLVDRFHRRGQAHCDLKRAPNILLGDDGHPYVVDWSASISAREFGFFPLNRVYRRFVLDDYLAITKLKLRHRPETVTDQEKERYSQRSDLERVIRRIRDSLREVLQKVS